MLASLDDPDLGDRYELVTSTRANRFNFRPQAAAGDYVAWQSLPELAEAQPLSGVQEMRKGALIDIDRQPLDARMRRYLDPTLSFATVGAEGAGPVESAGRFDPEAARRRIVGTEPFDPTRIVRYAMLPLDGRWAYHTNVRPIWNEPRPELAGQVHDGNLFIIGRMMAERPREGLPVLASRTLADYHLLRPNVQAIPVRLYRNDATQKGLFGDQPASRANLSVAARTWLAALDWPDPDREVEAGAAPWLHALAICCSPAWLDENRAAILAGWPRVPLPASAKSLAASARLGARLADLLDPDRPVPGVTTGEPALPLGVLGVITRFGGGALNVAQMALTAGWGHGGNGRPVMPARGRLTERDSYTAEELVEITKAAEARGETPEALTARLGPPVDVWLNELAYWRTVPRSVWDFTIGGYQVLKKWLSYREQGVLGRPLTAAEAREATAIIRRLAAVVLMGPELDANYRDVCAAAHPWHAAPIDDRVA